MLIWTENIRAVIGLRHDLGTPITPVSPISKYQGVTECKVLRVVDAYGMPAWLAKMAPSNSYLMKTAKEIECCRRSGWRSALEIYPF